MALAIAPPFENKGHLSGHYALAQDAICLLLKNSSAPRSSILCPCRIINNKTKHAAHRVHAHTTFAIHRRHNRDQDCLHTTCQERAYRRTQSITYVRTHSD
jgi:hypothetical protein